jgi:large subunit ribosomal protein L4e
MVNIYSLNGKVVGKVKLPEVFNTEYRPDLIQRAVVTLQSQRRQPYGVSELAGMQTSAAYFGRRRDAYRMTINRGMSRLPREKTGGGGLGRVRMVPQSVGGRRAHPSKKEKNFEKKINNKEYKYALKSSLAALTKKELALARGHKVPETIKEIPLIIEDKFEKLNKTKEVMKVLNAIGLENELSRAKEKKVRAGKGKMRGRKYKKKKSLLIVVNEDKGIISGGRNIPGVDVIKLNDLNVELLAPGTHAGRLSLWTKGAIENINKIIDGNDGSK